MTQKIYTELKDWLREFRIDPSGHTDAALDFAQYLVEKEAVSTVIVKSGEQFCFRCKRYGAIGEPLQHEPDCSHLKAKQLVAPQELPS